MKALIKLFTVLALLISVSAQAGEKIYFVQSDHLGTPEILTDENQNIVWRVGKDPFGDATPTVEQITFNIRFPGQYYDLETGLHYNWNRYYDAETGRYVTSDPIGLQGGLNTYGYVYGNPIRYSDPTGLDGALDRPDVMAPSPPAQSCEDDCQKITLTVDVNTVEEADRLNRNRAVGMTVTGILAAPLAAYCAAGLGASAGVASAVGSSTGAAIGLKEAFFGSPIYPGDRIIYEYTICCNPDSDFGSSVSGESAEVIRGGAK